MSNTKNPNSELTEKQFKSFLTVFNKLVKAQKILNNRNIKVTQSSLAATLKVSRNTTKNWLKKHKILIIQDKILASYKPHQMVKGYTFPHHNGTVPTASSICNPLFFANLSNLEISLLSALENDKYFAPNTGIKTRSSFVTSIFNISQIVAQSERVNRANKDYKYLLEFDKRYSFTKLFERHGNYVPGIRSYKTKFSNYFLNTIMPSTLDIYSQMDHKRAIPADNDLVIPFIKLKELSPRDAFILLVNMKGIHNDSFVITYKEKDEQFSRKYNQFTAIKSDSRKKLGYKNYDISAALQGIVFNFLDANKYPVHKRLITDKHELRAELKETLNKELPKIKQMLTAADNGKAYNKDRKVSATLDTYIAESKNIALDFTNKIKEINPEFYERALSMAKNEFRTTWKDGKKVVKALDTKNKYSVFFFIWTQIEREARNAMISCFNNKDDVREVHDAVYSKEVVTAATLEDAILNQTGLNLKIEID